MEKQKLVERQHFYAAEFEQEAAWLSLMQREGWRLASASGLHYTFEACEKEDWEYQLDFRENGKTEEEGWEYVTKHGAWQYFRRKRPAAEAADGSPFGDARTKMERLERIIRGTVKKCIPLFLILLAFEFLIWGTSFMEGAGVWHAVLTAGAVIFLIAAVFGFGVYIGQLDRLQKLREKLEKESA
jgi:hypothetical protein